MAVEEMIEALIGREGAYTNDPDDPGGATIWGVTERVARKNGYTGQMQAMTRDQAKAIYRSEYWIRPGFSDVAMISQAIAEELFDTGVNQGIAKASEYLQRSLNCFNNEAAIYPDIKVDCDIGPGTVKALRALIDKRGKDGEKVIIRALNALQGARYIEITEARPRNEKYCFGWFLQRVG